MGNKSRGSTIYSPPPGYDGNAFSDNLTVKLHEPNEEIITPEKNSMDSDIYSPLRSESIADDENNKAKKHLDENAITEVLHETGEERQPTSSDISDTNDTSAAADGKKNETVRSIESLLCNLRGKLGREELIIILVMILVASEGFSAELIILAVLLAAG